MRRNSASGPDCLHLMHKIGIIYNEPLSKGSDNWESSADVLAQVEAVEQALRELGYEPARIPFTLDLNNFISAISRENPAMVFNLCESVNEDPKLIGHPAAVLELLAIPFTGSSALALMLSTDKLITKRMLVSLGIKTPNYHLIEKTGDLSAIDLKLPVIIKPRFEDASIGIEQDSICKSHRDLAGKVKRLLKIYGDLIVEEYINGSEFNISLLGYPKPNMLPIAEINFSGLPDGFMPIVSYQAKWDKDSVEYLNTPRIFPKNLPLFFSKSIKAIAMESFRTFMLRDYGRVDIRVDERGCIYVLEVNANPCLSPDAGFAAAAGQENINYTELVNTLVKFTMTRKKHDANKANYS